MWAGFERADAIVGLGISIAIFVVLRGAARQIYGRLMDAVDPAIVDQVETVAAASPGSSRSWLSASLDRAPARGSYLDIMVPGGFQCVMAIRIARRRTRSICSMPSCTSNHADVHVDLMTWMPTREQGHHGSTLTHCGWQWRARAMRPWRVGIGANERLWLVVDALVVPGVNAVSTIYRDEIVAEARAELLEVDGALVWIDPIGHGED